MPRPIRHRMVLVLSVLAVVATGCREGSTTKGGQPSTPSVASAPSTAPAEPAFPVTVTAGNGEVTVEARPDRIVSLSPTATEMLFAIGAGDQVVAVDDNSTYPPSAPRTDLSGLEPNVEAIAGFAPDLVVISNDFGLGEQLAKVDIPLLLEPAAEDLEDTYAQIQLLGTATGHGDDALALVEEMRSEVDEIVGSVPAAARDATYYHELDPSFFSATSDTFIGKVYGLLGLRNIADQASDAGTQYPQLSAEFIVDADPDLIFLADTKCCGESAETVAARPGWGGISAVENEGVIELDDDVASRWGPRVVDFLRTVAGALGRLEGAA